MTQIELSIKSSIPQQTISAIERQEYGNPGVLTMRRLADALDCAIDDIVPSNDKEDETA